MRRLLERPIAGVQAWRYLYLLAFLIGAMQDWFGERDGDLRSWEDVRIASEDELAPVRRKTPARFDVDELEKVHEEGAELAPAPE